MADGLIPHNPSIQTLEQAKNILLKQDWINGDGFFYITTDCQCLEVRQVADIVQSLQMYGILDWSSSKDRKNDLTLIVPDSHKAIFDQLGITPRNLHIRTSGQENPGDTDKGPVR